MFVIFHKSPICVSQWNRCLCISHVSVYSVLHNELGMSRHNETYVFACSHAKTGPTNLCIPQWNMHICAGEPTVQVLITHPIQYMMGILG